MKSTVPVHEALVQASSWCFLMQKRRTIVPHDEFGFVVYDLQNECEGVVRSYVHWLYAGEMAEVLSLDSENLGFWLREAFDFSLGYDMQDFADAVLDQVIEYVQHGAWLTPSSRFRRVLTHFKSVAESHSRCKQLLLDLALRLERGTGWVPLKFDDFASDLLRLAMRELSKSEADEKATNPFTVDHCIYHSHTENHEPCYKTKFATKTPAG